MGSNAAERVMRARSSLVLTQPFFGALALRLKVIEDPSCKDAMKTNGKLLVFNPAKVDKLSDAELKGLVAHDIMHCAAGHPWRRDARDAKMWNQAADYAINPILQDCNFTLPKDALVRSDFKGKSSEEIYTVLLKENPPSGGGGKGKGKGKGGKGKPQSGGGQPGDGDEQGDGDGDESDQPSGGFDDGGSDPADAKEQEANWKVATAQAAAQAKLQGKLPGALERLVEENQRNKVDWKSVLRRFMTQVQKSDYSWRKPRARYAAMGIYLPEFYSEAMPPIVVAVDTSGSIGQAELNLFGAEINAIVKEARPEKTYIVYCDAQVNHVDEFLPDEEIVLKPHGGGGTSFKPPFRYVEKNDIEPACLIYLTDMYGDFPERAPSFPTLWCSTTQKMEAPFGEVLYVGDDWVE